MVNRADLKVVKALIKRIYEDGDVLNLELVDGTSPGIHARVDSYILSQAMPVHAIIDDPNIFSTISAKSHCYSTSYHNYTFSSLSSHI